MGFFARLSVLVSACFPLSLVMQAAAWCSVGTRYCGQLLHLFTGCGSHRSSIVSVSILSQIYRHMPLFFLLNVFAAGKNHILGIKQAKEVSR